MLNVGLLADNSLGVSASRFNPGVTELGQPKQFSAA